MAADPMQADIATKSPHKITPGARAPGGATVVAKLDGGSEVGYDILVERAGVYGLEAKCSRPLVFTDLVDNLHQNFTGAYLC